MFRIRLDSKIFTLALFIIGYTVFMIVTSITSAVVPPDARILSPVFLVSALLIGCKRDKAHTKGERREAIH